LNLRGSDIAFNPVFFAFLAIPTDPKSAPTLFIDIDKLPQATYDHLMANEILLEPYNDVYAHMKKIGSSLSTEVHPAGVIVLTDANLLSYVQQRVVLPSKTNLAIALAAGIEKCDAATRGPVVDLKAIKNEVEIEGFRQSHLRDGSALVRYFSWLERELNKGNKLKEYDAAKQLERFRS
jgi:Xaa-Pro aminopeptidase